MLSFEISLPEDTEAEIVEWFEFMNQQCILSKELISLVSQRISSQPMHLEAATTDFSTENSLEDPLANLFNWEASTSTLFTEDKKQKKKMLMV